MARPHAKRPLVAARRHPQEKIFCPRPAAQGRHVPSLANHGSSRGSPAAPGASAGSVVPRGPCAPLRVSRCGRAIAPASVFATAFGQPASRSASGSGLSQPPTLTRGLSRVNLLGAPGPRVTPSQRLQRPALWGVRACVSRVVRAVTRRPRAAGGGIPAGRDRPVTA